MSELKQKILDKVKGPGLWALATITEEGNLGALRHSHGR